MEDTLKLKGVEPNQDQRKKNKLKRVIRTSAIGWAFVLPAVILMLIFTIYPIFNSLICAFKQDYRLISNSFNGWGFENFRKVISNEAASGSAAQFGTCLINTLIFAFISVPVSTLLALLIAVGLNSIKYVQKLYQTVLFLPYLTNAMAMGAVFATFFNVVGTPSNTETVGLFNNFLGWFGIPAQNWINGSQLGQAFDPAKGRFVVIVYEVWSGLPFKILILFSAIQNVGKQHYDAARIDGASKSTILWKITVPLISPMLSYLLITGIMGGLKAYTAIVGLFGQDMGPGGDFSMGTMVGYIYQSIYENNIGYAAAGSLILFAIIMVITAINLYVSKKRVHY